ncbi:MAG TPA: hypothetical protein PKB14_19340 [Rubrivivax sp.]|nr:hypothetical protein [Rubrivivax sp.]
MGAALLWAAASAPAQAQGAPATVYRCPGPPVLYTDTLSAQEARERGCRTIEGTPITVIQGRTPAPRPAGNTAGSTAGAPGAQAAPRSADTRIDAGAQRARDTDSRRILEGELRREEERLAELKREYNNGEPERQGNERNYQKYLDRVAEMKSGIARKESDIAAIKRELAKLPPP